VLGGLFSLLLTSSLLLKQKSKYLLLKRQLAKGNKRLMEYPSGLTGK